MPRFAANLGWLFPELPPACPVRRFRDPVSTPATSIAIGAALDDEEGSRSSPG